MNLAVRVLIRIATWEIAREGYPLSADEALSEWASGNCWEPGQIRLRRPTLHLISAINSQVAGGAEQL